MDKILSQDLLLTKFTRAVTKKTCVHELWFLHSACWPVLVNIYMETHENILNILKLKIGHDHVTKTAIFKVQRGIIKTNMLCKSYGSCILQVVLLGLIFVWSFMKISWTVLML